MMEDGGSREGDSDPGRPPQPARRGRVSPPGCSRGRGFPAAPLADSLVDSAVFRWLKKAGDRVRKGEPLVEIETDMVRAKLKSPVETVLPEIVVPVRKTAAVGAVIARHAEREGA